MPEFTLMQKTLNLEEIEGKYSAFAKCPYALPVRLAKPLAPDGYGTITVNGQKISRGQTFFMDMILKTYCMLLFLSVRLSSLLLGECCDSPEGARNRHKYHQMRADSGVFDDFVDLRSDKI